MLMVLTAIEHINKLAIIHQHISEEIQMQNEVQLLHGKNFYIMKDLLG